MLTYFSVFLKQFTCVSCDRHRQRSMLI